MAATRSGENYIYWNQGTWSVGPLSNSLLLDSSLPWANLTSLAAAASSAEAVDLVGACVNGICDSGVWVPEMAVQCTTHNLDAQEL